jgi:Flp pilus assembly protein TadD
VKIVFFGNCQAGALHALYIRYVQPYSGHESFHVASHNAKTDASAELLANADLIAGQAQDFAAKAGPLTPRDGLIIHKFPVVAGNFLWPYAGRERPGNKAETGFPLGPFPAQLGDSQLNRLIRDGVDPEEAARQYIEMDVAKAMDLDRLYDIVVSKQKRMDQELGFDVGSIVEEHFRDEQLFRTSYHPETRIMKHLAMTLFRSMGVEEAIIKRIDRWQKNAGLPPPECPIHPSVARHFGLRYIDDNTRYRFHGEGFYTFEEWVRRYIAGTWNKTLAEGLDRTGHRRAPVPTQAILAKALAESPTSGPGWSAMATNLARQGKVQEAIQAARTAVTHDPETARHYIYLGSLLFRTGDHAGAAETFRTAWELDPPARDARRMLPMALLQCGDVEGAMQFMREQLEDPMEPPNSEQYAMLARLLERAGDVPGALRYAELAVRCSPPHLSAFTVYSDILGRLNRHKEAEIYLRRALAIQPDAPTLLFGLSRVCFAAHDDAAATDAVRQAIAADPGKWQYHGHLGRVLARRGMIEEAEQACDDALALRPNEPSLTKLRTYLMERLERTHKQPQAVLPAA